METLIDRVIKTIEEYRLLKRDDSVLVALSGGPDSVALLHILQYLRGKYRVMLTAAHLDHAIRPESSAEREFCRRLCRQLEIKFHSRRFDITARAKDDKLSVEEAGREARYEYFHSLCEEYGYDKIATGHTTDDNAETVIFNITRGSGLRGIAGIPAKRGKIIRPLLEIEKRELLEYLKDKKIRYLSDLSNRSLYFSRNMIRLKVMPQLEKLNPSVKKTILRLSKNIAEDIEFIESITVSSYKKVLVKAANNKIVLDLGKLGDYDKVLKKKVVAEAYLRLTGVSNYPSFRALSRAVEICEGRSGAKSHLSQRIWIEKSQNRIAISRSVACATNVKLSIPGITEIPFSDKYLKAEVLRRTGVKKLKMKPDTAFLDYSKLREVMVRFWKNGDRIRPFGMRGTRLLSDVFIDNKIPTFEREWVPLIASGGEIAWVAGVMISDDFKVDRGTKKILKIELCV